MAARSPFPSLQRVLTTLVHGCESLVAVEAARALSSEVRVVGMVKLAEGESMSAGAQKAQEMRKRLRRLAALPGIQTRGNVIVSFQPWLDLQQLIAAEKPDLLVLECCDQLSALGLTLTEVLARPPCDLALVRGPVVSGAPAPFPERPARVLIPIRGGPYAELALRIGLSLQAEELTALHIELKSDGGSNAPFKGLERVLARLPEVQKRSVVTEDTAKTILEESRHYDLVVMGAAARPLHGVSGLGPVAERILSDSPAAVMVVRTRRSMPDAVTDETIGAQAISILVDKWFAENTFDADEFADLEQLVRLKREQQLTISLALPALNEEATVGKVIRTVKRALMDRVPLLDEIVLIDSDSTDRTRAIAQRLGVPVYIHQQLLPELGARAGKGEALWKSLLVTRGDLIAWIDTDIVNIHPRFVYGILGPLLLNPRIQFVKGFYRRPLRVGDKVQAGGGGRVTELTARPLLNLFYPELSGVVQPLSGEYAGRRSALEQCPFFSGYGVEIGLLIEIFERYGLAGLAQVDLLERIHHNQTLEALSKMSFAIIQAVMRKLERHYERAIVADVNKTMKLIRHEAAGYFLEVEEIAERERPPMIEVEEYRRRRAEAR
ncbi:MAG: glucosyl-3-phosphoglycerate synthase [Anaerolineales bacterium]|nr:glucosyl-3-phosphoglycerate synthase [Anaerolineales bacterium]